MKRNDLELRLESSLAENQLLRNQNTALERTIEREKERIQDLNSERSDKIFRFFIVGVILLIVFACAEMAIVTGNYSVSERFGYSGLSFFLFCICLVFGCFS